MTVDISICIANYNGEDVLPGCIDSIRQQQSRFCYEILVHDDASSDASMDYLRSLADDVVVIASEDNVGFCVGNNRMAERAQGRYLLLLNNDAELLPGALDALMAEISPAVGVVTLPQYQFDDGELFDRGMRLDLFANPVPNLDPQRSEVLTVMGSLLLIETALWQQIGGFPAWFGSIGEDLYLCLYARLLGREARVASGSGYRHRIGYSFGGGKVVESQLATTFRRRALSERNKSYVMALLYPGVLMYPILLLHLLLLLLEGSLLSLLRWDLRFLRQIYGPAVLAVITQWPQLWRRRKVIQRQRRVSLRGFFNGFDYCPYKLRMLLKHGLPAVR